MHLPRNLLPLASVWMLLAVPAAHGAEDIDKSTDALVTRLQLELCRDKARAEVCPHLASFLKAHAPELPRGGLLTFGRYAVLEKARLGDELFLAVRGVWEADGVKLVTFPVRPENAEETEDSRHLMARLQSGERELSTSATYRFLQQATAKLDTFPAKATAHSLVYRDPSTGFANGSVILRQHGPWLYAFRLTGSGQQVTPVFAWLPLKGSKTDAK